jgi:hypothetical protein
MSSEQLPRVYELRDLIACLTSPAAYFQDFDNSLRDEPSKMKVWHACEREFQRLGPDAWEFLKGEAVPYLMKPDPKGRGWEQLFNILNQARAYNFLIDLGCSEVRFIPRSHKNKAKTPDLGARESDGKVLCEVKTLNISDEEVSRRLSGAVGSTVVDLNIGFFGKLMSGLHKAKEQMDLYDNSVVVRRIVYVIPHFDDFLGEYKTEYFQQIDQHLAKNRIPGLEVVIHNPRTSFHRPVVLQHAVVVNDPS